MKRWEVEYSAEGKVKRIEQSDQDFLGARPTPIRRNTSYFYCDAVDELGAFAKFKEAWKKKEQRDASMHIL